MTPEELNLLQTFATGPCDAYTIHRARITLNKLLEEYAKTLKENATLNDMLSANMVPKASGK